MPRIDFYVLAASGPEVRERFACRLAEKAVDLGHAVFVRTDSAGQAQELDRLMWTFSDRSFLPHELATGGDFAPARAPVLIGTGTAPAAHRELLVNLTTTMPADLADFERVAEIVDEDPERRRLARTRFKQYREQGFEPETHTL